MKYKDVLDLILTILAIVGALYLPILYAGYTNYRDYCAASCIEYSKETGYPTIARASPFSCSCIPDKSIIWVAHNKSKIEVLN